MRLEETVGEGEEFELEDRLIEELNALAERAGTPELRIAAELVEVALCRARAEADPRLRWTKLSYRQQEVALLIYQGFTYGEIADRLEIGLESVRTHARCAYKKMGVHDKQALRETMTKTEVMREYLEAYQAAAGAPETQDEAEGS